MDEMDLDKRFIYHAPKEYLVDRYANIRNNSYSLARVINELCPDGREKALAITKLEEVVMWANAAIARNAENNL